MNKIQFVSIDKNKYTVSKNHTKFANIKLDCLQ